jgi:hypothetical protein
VWSNQWDESAAIFSVDGLSLIHPKIASVFLSAHGPQPRAVLRDWKYEDISDA